MNSTIWFALIASVIAIAYGAFLINSILKKPAGNDRMKEIAAAIQAGAKAYLARQYRTIAIIAIILFIIVLLFLINGTLSTIWPDVKPPSCWFHSPGVLTEKELRTIVEQIAHTDIIVLDTDYDQHQEAWNWPELDAQRARFELLWEDKHFKVLKRRGT